MNIRFLWLFIVLAGGATSVFVPAQQRLPAPPPPPTTPPLKIALLNRHESDQTEAKFAAQLTQNLRQKNFKLLDADLGRAAANGAEIKNLFNLSLDEAKNLGTIIDCDFLLVIESQTLQRSSFQKNVYFEAYGIVFLVSARTGRLILWTDDTFEAETPTGAEKMLLAETNNIAAKFAAKTIETTEGERVQRTDKFVAEPVLIDNLPDTDEAAAAQNFRVPLPYKRLRPEYTAAARRRGIEATVDVAAELNERGEVTRTETIRWAGFELDEAAMNTIKKMQFRPALRDGKPLAIRILLRYNFRDLQKQ